jgi:putative oxygen-independent coproporphyrinogen III oxidase
MSGIYIHIPFCRQACHYCNFHFSVSQKRRGEFVQALLKEIALQKDFFQSDSKEIIHNTLYFGGGTPSLLDEAELAAIFEALHTNFSFADGAEITLEANPDDLTDEKLQMLKRTGINRLSIGIQSFREADLRYMNRSHSSQQAQWVLDRAKDAGFENITADLIYGTPGMDDVQWKENIMQLVDRNIPHISAYSLTVEKKTALDVFIRKGKAAPVDEEQSARQFDILCELAEAHGYDHYEISNWGKPGFYSRHNLSYWSGEPYLGLGPSAHSFVPGFRRWNVANTCRYIDSLAEYVIPFESEKLTIDQQYNEYVMTALRTQWGVDKEKILNQFGQKYLLEMLRQAAPYISKGWIAESTSHLAITRQGKFFSDGIAADLFVVG